MAWCQKHSWNYWTNRRQSIKHYDLVFQSIDASMCACYIFIFQTERKVRKCFGFYCFVIAQLAAYWSIFVEPSCTPLSIQQCHPQSVSFRLQNHSSTHTTIQTLFKRKEIVISTLVLAPCIHVHIYKFINEVKEKSKAIRFRPGLGIYR